MVPRAQADSGGDLSSACESSTCWWRQMLCQYWALLTAPSCRYLEECNSYSFAPDFSALSKPFHAGMHRSIADTVQKSGDPIARALLRVSSQAEMSARTVPETDADNVRRHCLLIKKVPVGDSRLVVVSCGKSWKHCV
eukprot:2169381-Rhodomonas_salina.1